ncbi:hypothetical protein [Acidovorax sp. SUPP3334]|uniref:hypothetical protein n=1 Tax=Acidovorax sp. SUPP3334 TaxID=2920881 RepID=UPI0023DE1F8B|nr:hypothetical protein [Acidovorax sp. SUPP3334]GKT22546.1 hypothetical protein AVHM3334_08785 [Acidovorax sp. SUPP3334]
MSMTTFSSVQLAASAELVRLAAVIADKVEDGTLFEAGIYSRKELAEVLRRVTAVVSAPASKTFDDLPLATCSLSIEERAKWINVLDPLLKYAGRPGDWGRESKLGLLTQRLLQVRQELTQGEVKEGGTA